VKKSFLVAAVMAVAGLSVERPALAGELQLDIAGIAAASTWRGDFGLGGQLRLGYRFAKIVAVDFVGWEQYMAIDHRLDTGVTFGVSGFLPLGIVRPFLRLFFIHQHEEALVSVEENPAGTIFGVGDGIRHRAGGGGVAGVEVAFAKRGNMEFLALGGFSTTLFPDASLGPSAYFGLTAGLGINYFVEALP
jgi:hypothetical protein